MNTLNTPASPVSLPVLQQPKATLTTNELIVPKPTNVPVVPVVPVVPEPSATKINENLAITLIEVLDECLNKPDDKLWKEYTKEVVMKKERLLYIIIFLLFVILFAVMVF